MDDDIGISFKGNMTIDPATTVDPIQAVKEYVTNLLLRNKYIIKSNVYVQELGHNRYSYSVRFDGPDQTAV